MMILLKLSITSIQFQIFSINHRNEKKNVIFCSSLVPFQLKSIDRMILFFSFITSTMKSK